MFPARNRRRPPSKVPSKSRVEVAGATEEELARARGCAPPARLTSQSCVRAGSASGAVCAATRRSFRSRAGRHWDKAAATRRAVFFFLFSHQPPRGEANIDRPDGLIDKLY